MKSIEELKGDRLAHVSNNKEEFGIALRRVFEAIEANNLTGKRRIKLNVGEVAHTKWNYHIAELLKDYGFGVRIRCDKNGESISITW